MKRKTILIISALAVVIAYLLVVMTSGKADQKRVQDLHSQQGQIQELQKSMHELEIQFDKTEQDKQKLQQEKQDQQKQIDDLNKQLSIKKAAQAQVATLQRVGGNCESYRPLFAQYGWDVQTAMAIMDAESGCNPTAVSPTNDHGLMQINQGLAIYGQQIYDPAFNIQIAYNEKYLKGGWGHWTVYKTGAYLKYLGV